MAAVLSPARRAASPPATPPVQSLAQLRRLVVGRRWQLLPPLAADELDLLRANIRAKGVLVPLEVDASTGELLDGHHRLLIAREAGLPDEAIPVITRMFASDDQRTAHVLGLNAARRNLSPTQRRALVAWLCGEERWAATKVAATLRAGRQTIYRDLALLRAADPNFRLPGESTGRLRRLRNGEVRPYVRKKAPAAPTLSGRMSEGLSGRRWVPGSPEDLARLQRTMLGELHRWARFHQLHFLADDGLHQLFAGVLREINRLPLPPGVRRTVAGPQGPRRP